MKDINTLLVMLSEVALQKYKPVVHYIPYKDICEETKEYDTMSTSNYNNDYDVANHKELLIHKSGCIKIGDAWLMTHESQGKYTGAEIDRSTVEEMEKFRVQLEYNAFGPEV